MGLFGFDIARALLALLGWLEVVCTGCVQDLCVFCFCIAGRRKLSLVQYYFKFRRLDTGKLCSYQRNIESSFGSQKMYLSGWFLPG